MVQQRPRLPPAAYVFAYHFSSQSTPLRRKPESPTPPGNQWSRLSDSQKITVDEQIMTIMHRFLYAVDDLSSSVQVLTRWLQSAATCPAPSSSCAPTPFWLNWKVCLTPLWPTTLSPCAQAPVLPSEANYRLLSHLLLHAPSWASAVKRSPFLAMHSSVYYYLVQVGALIFQFFTG